jgi:very-short-patch-repair endonuclease
MLGLKFRRQHPVAGFVLDFYCAELRLAIELDGCVHDDPQQRARDAERTRRLEALRIRVVRIPNSRVSEAKLRHLIQPSVPPLRVCGEGARG